MPNLKPGDILEWDCEHKSFGEVVRSGFENDGPFVMTRPNGNAWCYVKRLNGLPFTCRDGECELSWFRYRFRKHAFLNAAKEAIANA